MILVFLLLAADPFVESEDFGKWFETRVKATEREILRVPLVSHPPWGCECPDRYFGLNDMSYGGKAWIAVEGVKDHPLLEPGHLALAEGYLTGATYTVGEYEVFAFHVLRLRPFTGEQDETNPNARAQVLLSGPLAKESPPPLDKTKPWAVIVASIPLADKTAKAQAAEKAKAIGGEAFDSRSATGLACCYEVVVYGRYASEAEAKAALAKAKIKGAYVKRAVQ